MNDSTKHKKLSHPLIMGKNCLEEVLKYAPERLIMVYTAKDCGPFLQKIQDRGVPHKFLSNAELTRMVQSDSHQSFVAMVRERPHLDLGSFLENAPERSLVLMLDSIFDPQNLGAILRVAECFGVDAVVWSKNRGTDLTPAACKASAGASELIPIIKVANLAEAMRKCQDADYWAVTAEADPGAEDFHNFSFPARTLLIMGSEGKGVQPLISKRADSKVYIPMRGKISSLNVTQATAVLLSKYV